MNDQRPLILFTNDDGIHSPGLWASAAAFADLGDILIVAPREQQSGTGRSMPIKLPHILTQFATKHSPKISAS